MQKAGQRAFYLQKLAQTSTTFGSSSVRCFGAVVKPDVNHKFIDASATKRFVALDGLRGSSSATMVFDNGFHHMNDLPLTQ
jgi:hypothetical protein